MALTKELIDQMLAAQQGTPKITPQPFQNYAPLSMIANYGPDKAQNNALIGAIAGTEEAQHQQFMTGIANAKQSAIVQRQRNELDQLRGQLDGGGQQDRPQPQANRQQPQKKKQQPTRPEPRISEPTPQQKVAARDVPNHMQTTLPPHIQALASKYGLVRR